MIEAEVSTSDPTPNVADDAVEFQRSISDGFNEVGGTQKSSSRNKRLYCFACHRMEYHYNALKGTSYHHLLVGFTFGLVWLFGPFRCRCCGYRRMCRFNFLNLRYHYHRWKYAAKGSAPSKKDNSSGSTSRRRSSSQREKEIEHPPEKIAIVRLDPEPDDIGSSGRRRRRRKRKKLKSVPAIDTIGKERRDREKLVEYVEPKVQATDFSIDGIVSSFETEESRKARLEEIAINRINKDPFVARKAKTRKKVKGKPKRRYAKKERLSGPKVHCFGCKQTHEHYHVLKGSGYYPFLFGITFGLSALIGPFRCSVCSKKRLSGLDFLNPKFYLRDFLSNSKNGYGG